MNQSLLRFMKGIPMLYPAIRYVTGTMIQMPTGQPNATFFSYKKNIRDGEAYEITKLDKG